MSALAVTGVGVGAYANNLSQGQGSVTESVQAPTGIEELCKSTSNNRYIIGTVEEVISNIPPHSSGSSVDNPFFGLVLKADDGKVYYLDIRYDQLLDGQFGTRTTKFGLAMATKKGTKYVISRTIGFKATNVFDETGIGYAGSGDVLPCLFP